MDTLFGGDGADTFIFEAAHAYTDNDILADFSAGEGDTLDISDLISGFSGNINDHLFLDDSSGTDTIIRVDSDGTAGGTNFQAVATINGITGLDETTLFNEGLAFIEYVYSSLNPSPTLTNSLINHSICQIQYRFCYIFIHISHPFLPLPFLSNFRYFLANENSYH